MDYQIENLISENVLKKRVKFLAETLNKDYQDKQDLVAICLLKGAYTFFSDIVRELKVSNINIDFLQASSYNKGLDSSLNVVIKKDVEINIKDKDVILFDDIIDTGLTLTKIKSFLEVKEPKSLKICTLLDKPFRRRVSLKSDYVGFEIPDEFVVGYGIDYAERHRELKYIGKVVFNST